MGQVMQEDIDRTADIVAISQLPYFCAGKLNHLLIQRIVLLLGVKVLLCGLSIQPSSRGESINDDFVDHSKFDGGVAVEGEIPDRNGDGGYSTEEGLRLLKCTMRNKEAIKY